MRRADGFARQAVADNPVAWVKIAIMIKGNAWRFPAFWQLQIVGWGGFYVLVLAVSLPYLKLENTFSDDNWFVGTLFLASCLLRPVCRSLTRRAHAWLALEAWAFAWSLGLGAAAALGTDVVISGLKNIDWAQWLVNSVQYLVMLILWCNLYFSIKQWRQSAAESDRLLRAEAEVREARLSALRYQLNPHFLFNSLNAVSTLVLEGNAPAATRMLAQIGEFLRTTLGRDVVAEVPLAQEIALAEQYLAIEQTRLGDRLRVNVTIAPETIDALVPNMLLQPLVENAVRHGVALLIEGGTIAIASKLDNAQLQIVVRNSGTQDAGLVKPEHTAGNGIGLTNTAARLKMLYGLDHKFVLAWPAADICEVTVTLPFKKS